MVVAVRDARRGLPRQHHHHLLPGSADVLRDCVSRLRPDVAALTLGRLASAFHVVAADSREEAPLRRVA
jgi:hypothetical protein